MYVCTVMLFGFINQHNYVEPGNSYHITHLECSYDQSKVAKVTPLRNQRMVGLEGGIFPKI